MIRPIMRRTVLLGLCLAFSNVSSAFAPPLTAKTTPVSVFGTHGREGGLPWLQAFQQGNGPEAGAEEDVQASEIETYLADYYPSFYNLMLVNAVDVLKELRQPGRAFTIFAPNDQAFEALGDKKLQQLRDPRNLETTNKMAAFHTVLGDDANDVVTAEAILAPDSTIGGVMTLAGELPIGPSESGGFLGLGAKADGGVVVGPTAKIVQSINGPGGIVHEVDALVCPNIIWRYMDQLRLPGL